MSIFPLVIIPIILGIVLGLFMWKHYKNEHDQISVEKKNSNKKNIIIDKSLALSVVYGFLISLVLLVIILYLDVGNGKILAASFFYNCFPISSLTDTRFFDKLSTYVASAFIGIQYFASIWIVISAIIFFFKKFTIKFK